MVLVKVYGEVMRLGTGREILFVLIRVMRVDRIYVAAKNDPRASHELTPTKNPCAPVPRRLTSPDSMRDISSISSSDSAP